jgi:hypothetical protein
MQPCERSKRGATTHTSRMAYRLMRRHKLPSILRNSRGKRFVSKNAARYAEISAPLRRWATCGAELRPAVRFEDRFPGSVDIVHDGQTACFKLSGRHLLHRVPKCTWSRCHDHDNMQARSTSWISLFLRKSFRNAGSRITVFVALRSAFLRLTMQRFH